MYYWSQGFSFQKTFIPTEKSFELANFHGPPVRETTLQNKKEKKKLGGIFFHNESVQSNNTSGSDLDGGDT